MVQHIGKSILDFSHYIAERTQHFTAREWVFKAIDEWLIDTHGPRFFLLEGEPGSGKTAIAARLSQISQGAIAQQGLIVLTRSIISAVHFCNARDTLSIDPLTFVNSVATQLANCYPGYLDLLSSQSENRQIHINVQQNVQQVVNGQIAGVIINVSAPAPESAFNWAIREPLEILLRTKPDEHVVILVDALDEALAYSGMSNIVALLAHIDGLSSHVRFILTTRSEEQVMSEFTDRQKLSLSVAHDQRCQEDISRYVQLRLKDDPLLAEKVAQVDHNQVARLIGALVLKSDGNFQFVRLLLDSIAKDLRGLLELEGLPIGLDWLYFDSLKRVVQRERWANYRPLLGVLAVAQESLSIVQLQAFTSQSEETIWQYLGDLQQFIEEVKSQNEKGALVTGYRLFHESFHDFLHAQSLVVNDVEIRNPFFLSRVGWHRALADFCEGSDGAKIWEEARHQPIEQARREYARLYYVTHLYQSQQWQRLFAVLDAGQYGRGKIHYDPSTLLYAQDLDLGRYAATYKDWSLEEGIQLLPQLWRYTLLRCSLVTHAAQYPPAAFKLLMILGQEQKAWRLAELQINPVNKTETLLGIAKELRQRPSRHQECVQTLLMAYKTAESLKDEEVKGELLKKVAEELAQVQEFDQTEQVIRSIKSSRWKAVALGILGKALSQAHQSERSERIWKEAEEIGRSLSRIDDKSRVLMYLAIEMAQAHQWVRAQEIISFIEDETDDKVTALAELGKALDAAREHKRAQLVWTKALQISTNRRSSESQAYALMDVGDGLVLHDLGQIEKSIKQVNNIETRVYLLSIMARELARQGMQEKAQRICMDAKNTLENTPLPSWPTIPASAFDALGKAFAQLRMWEQAETMWEQALIHWHEADFSDADNPPPPKRTSALGKVGKALIQASEWKQAEAVIRAIKSPDEKLEVFIELAIALAQKQHVGQATELWTEAEGMLHIMEDSTITKTDALCQLSEALVQAQAWEQAEQIWSEIKQILSQIESKEDRDHGLIELSMVLARVHRWEQAEEIAEMIERDIDKHHTLGYLTEILAQAYQWERAEKVIHKFDSRLDGYQALEALGLSLAQTGKWERAEKVISSIPSSWLPPRALYKLGALTIKAQEWERTKAVIKRMGKSTEKWDDDIFSYTFQKSQLQYETGLALAHAQKWEQAEAMIHTIEQLDKRAIALTELSRILIEACHQERAELTQRKAEEIISIIKGNYEKAGALIALGRAKALMHRLKEARNAWKEAESLIETTKYPREYDAKKMERLLQLAKALVEVRDWERVEVILDVVRKAWKESEEELRSAIGVMERWMQIENWSTSSKVQESVSQLAEVLIEARDWERSETILSILVSWGVYAEVDKLIKILLPLQRIEAVLDTIDRICDKANTYKDHDIHIIRKVATWHILLKNLALVGKHEYLLHVIYHAWLGVYPRKTCIQCLPLVSELLPLNIEIGKAFYESFSWVDTFLKA